jgi:raffinose/stachyose/melibiose transport system permease protein
MRTAGQRRVERGFQFSRTMILVLGALAGLTPLLFMGITALRSSRDYFAAPIALPDGIDFSNFERALELDVGRWFANSVLVTGAAVLLATVLSVFAGYAFVRLRFRGASTLLAGIVGLMLIPPIVLLVPLFTTMSDVGLVSNPLSVVLVYAGLTFPFSVFMVVRFMDAIPSELFESAVIDGASHFQILWRIVVPLARPILTTVVIVNVLYAWNELLIASVFLQDESSRTLQAGLAQLEGRFQTEVPLVFAGAVLSTLPILAVIAFGQRQFVEGMVDGSVKG